MTEVYDEFRAAVNMTAGELEKAGIYHVEHDADAALEAAFMNIARHEASDATEIEVEGRMIRTRRDARGLPLAGQVALVAAGGRRGELHGGQGRGGRCGGPPPHRDAGP